MRFITICLLLAIIAGALFATNPRAADFEAEIEAQLTTTIINTDPAELDDDLAALLLTTCQLGGGSACARLLRSLMEVEITDNLLFSAATVRLGNGDPRQCYGALTRVICL